ncbi:signal transduction histidine kinase [Actinocorallia herbida]|uniref:histidine kinase n=1 Tax=Actinocorallia herbida TaxID=58109 RepID=A0A3N1CVK2_9ACTN|nr:histidine kinase [Actinocorallia herbida]ROO85321.1 signal transduction histidine kinase [Actinocorallia herbida]
MRHPPSAAVASVVVGIGGLTAGTVWGQSDGTFLTLDLLAGAAALVAALVQLWRPFPGALAAVLLAAVSPAATPAATFGALQTARRGPFGRAAGVAALGVAAHVGQGLLRPNPGIALGWWLLLVCAAYAALLGWGALARSRHALLVSLHERALRAEAEQGRRVAEARMAERRALAREMHDVLAHRLTLVATYAGALEYRTDVSPQQVSQAAGVVRAGVHAALEELRQVIGLLGEEDEHDDLVPPPTLADLARLADEARHSGQRVRLVDETEGAVLPSGVGRTGYRVVQEALTNARKHAPGQPVEVHVHGEPGERLRIDVRNPLADPVQEPAFPGSGTGLVGLTERVRLAGGRLDHRAGDGEFVVNARLPWPA